MNILMINLLKILISNLTIENLDANSTATQSTTAFADPDRNNNEYYKYSFNINLKSNYCLFENNQVLSTIPNLDDLWTSILVKANVNIDTFKQNVIAFANSISNINQLLGEGSQKGLEIAQSSNIVSDSNLITSVDFVDITTSDDSVVKLKATINYSTNQEPTIVEIDTNMKIVNLNQEALISYFWDTVNSQTYIDNPVQTLENSNSGLVSGCLSDSTSITQTSKGYINLVDTPFNAYDVSIVLNDNYCFYDFSHKTMSSSQVVSNIMSRIPYDIVPTSSTLENYIKTNFNTCSTAQTLLNMSSEELVNLFNQHSYVQDSLWIDSVELSTSNNGNQIQYNFLVNYHNGESSNLNILTDIQIVSFNQSQFNTYIKNIDNANQLSNDNIKQTIVDSASGIDNVGILSNSTSSTQLSSSSLNDVFNYNCYEYQFNIVLNDNYCFNDSINVISSSKELNNVLSGVYVPIEISSNAIDNIKSTLLNNVTIDNYKDYFDGADNNPSDPNISGVQNSGRMTKDKLSEISGSLILADAINTIKFVKSGNTDNGYLKVNIEITLNKPYEYQGQNVINLTDIATGMYDPNSEYNLGLFVYSDTSFTGFTNLGFNQEIIYFPYKMQFSMFTGYILQDNSNNIKKLDYSFATNFCNYSKNNAQFQGSKNLEQVVFDDNFNFNTFNSKGWMFVNCYKLKYVSFKGCTSLETLGFKTFIGCNSLTSVDLSNCLSLSILEDYLFSDCSSLESLDFSSCTLTSVASHVFNNCTSLKNIKVKDESSKQLILSALQAANIDNNVTIDIVN